MAPVRDELRSKNLCLMDQVTSQARSAAWKMGLIAAWYLRDDQLPLYHHLLEKKQPFLECSRQYGKTTSILVYVLEKLRQNPGWVCRWCEPNKNQAREVVMPAMDSIQKDCPESLRFKWQTTDSVYVGPGNSRLYLRGVNEDKGESARGAFSHIIVADEFGTWVEPDYIVNEALRPQLLTTDGQFIFASTPPRDLGHAYYRLRGIALTDERLIQRTIYDNASLSPARIEEICSDAGGASSPGWRREYMLEPVTDPEALIVPEYSEALHDLEDDEPRPEFCDKYVGADLGFNDWTAFLFGYFDFRNQTLVIEDEVVVSGRNSEEISNAAKGKEEELWGTERPFRRVADNELQQLHDMGTLHGYLLTPTRKDDKDAAISDLRVRFSQGKVRIKKRCKSLRYQLKVGIWDKRRKGFIRGDNIGHLDAIDALLYLHRNLSPNHNPYPPFLGARLETHYIPQQTPAPGGATKDVEALKGAFRPFGNSTGDFRRGFK
jgi:hypothetical protein